MSNSVRFKLSLEIRLVSFKNFGLEWCCPKKYLLLILVNKFENDLHMLMKPISNSITHGCYLLAALVDVNSLIYGSYVFYTQASIWNLMRALLASWDGRKVRQNCGGGEQNLSCPYQSYVARTRTRTRHGHGYGDTAIFEK